MPLSRFIEALCNSRKHDSHHALYPAAATSGSISESERLLLKSHARHSPDNRMIDEHAGLIEVLLVPLSEIWALRKGVGH
jgi:hypothetical protein